MASRITQAVRAAPVDAATGATGGASRITQASRAAAVDAGTISVGGAARITQISRVIIATIQLSTGGMMLKGVGS